MKKSICITLAKEFLKQQLYFSLLALSMCLFAFTAHAEVFKIAVVVNGKPITEYDVQAQLSLFAKALVTQTNGNIDPEELAQRKEAERPKIIEKMIEEQLLAEEISRVGMTVPDEQVELYIQRLREESNLLDDTFFIAELERMGHTLDEFKEKIRKDILRHKLVQAMVGSKVVVTDAEMEEAFQEVSKKMAAGMRCHLCVIMMNSENEADLAYRILQEGSEDFINVVAKYSVGPSPLQGGDIGFVPLYEMAPSWQTALQNVQPGEVTEPFPSEGKYIILKLVELAPLTSIDFPKEREKLFQKIQEQKMEELFDSYMNRLRETAVIEWK